MRRLFEWMKNSAGFLWLAIVAGYLCLAAGRAFYKNYQSQQQIASLRQQLAAEQAEKERLQALLVYYNTDDFKVKELRADLLLKQPAETVYALPEASGDTLSDENAPVAAAATARARPSGDPVWRQWLAYLLHGTR